MKKILLSLLACCAGSMLFSQVTNNSNTSGMQSNTVAKQMPAKPLGRSEILKLDPDAAQGCIYVENGTAMMLKNGDATELKSDTQLRNGATVHSDGTVHLHDGTNMKLRSGQCMEMNGSILVTDNSTSRINKDVGKSK